MVFSSFTFLFFFLPLCLTTYFLSPYRAKNFVLLFWSYFFYAWGAPNVVLILFLSSLFDFVLGRKIVSKPQSAKVFLTLGISANLGTLFYFKYSNFFISELSGLLLTLGLDSSFWKEVALPIGVSFFTFQKISYLVDVYRAKTQPAKSFIDYALYVALFPQLIAGPIIRYHEISEQIVKRSHSLQKTGYGVYRFCLGLGKKVLIADTLGNVADNIFALQPEQVGISFAWIGIICYAFQIYFDFSGYSDMAIGLGRIFGFKIPENFNAPYIATSVTDFWRRWHITLSAWMKEYLYIPLGGNRVSKLRMYLNLWIVFLLSGLWHGASWSFVVWGAFHGFFLVTDKIFWQKIADNLSPIISITITFIILLFSWVLFRAETLSYALAYWGQMVNFSSYGLNPTGMARAEIIHTRAWWTLGVAAFFSFFPIAEIKLPKLFSWTKSESEEGLGLAYRFAVSIPCLLLAILALSTASYSPFLYFRF